MEQREVLLTEQQGELMQERLLSSASCLNIVYCICKLNTVTVLVHVKYICNRADHVLCALRLRMTSYSFYATSLAHAVLHHMYTTPIVICFILY